VTTGHSRIPDVSSEWLGKTLSEDELRQCVDCHTTAPRAARDDAGALAHDRGIGCERCHGPGGNHLKAVAAELADLAIARPKLAHGEPIVRLCGQCHSPKGRTVSASDPNSIRFQATTLTWSRCYTQSKDQLDCVTCHDPHRNAETTHVFYEKKCLGCHGSTATTHCPVNSSRDCITCHMPARRGAAPHATFTDHHIRIHSSSQ
jgi:formate-dependent nitrite reductase cytochrome c552 subunit